jgi:hypothetical protein
MGTHKEDYTHLEISTDRWRLTQRHIQKDTRTQTRALAKRDMRACTHTYKCTEGEACKHRDRLGHKDTKMCTVGDREAHIERDTGKHTE